MLVYYFKEDIRNVTEYYYNIILEALESNGNHCIMLNRCSFNVLRTIPKRSYILATTLRTFILLYLARRRNIIYWYQGITPEEVHLMTGSKWKYVLYSYLEKLSLKTVRYKIGVSKYQFDHFEKKYRIRFGNSDCFIMPCFNTELNEQSFYTPNKYNRNVFCYAGGTQAWQGFDEVLSIYEMIESKREDVFLKIYSKDIDTAKKMVEQTHIKHYSIDCVPQSKMNDALADCKYGFIIRDDSVINNVATPTKLGTYIANGVIPIFSSTIKSFSDLADNYNFLCCVNNKEACGIILRQLDRSVLSSDVFSEYQKLFNEYYNRSSYIKGLKEYLVDISQSSI